MFFFTPRYIKEAKHYIHGAQKLLAYKRDILSVEQVSNIESCISALDSAMRKRSRDEVSRSMQSLEELIGQSVPPLKHPAIRENVEVFLVAIVIAAGVKAYLLQPFRIPTGSMQPTLYGIVGVPTETPPPNPLIRAFDFVFRGRHYFELRAKEDDVVVSLKERTYLNFFTFTDIVCRKRTYTLFVPQKPLMTGFHIVPGREYSTGDIIARGHMDTGDQVFVDKVSYNFSKPRLADVFVFKTTGIREIEAGLDPAMGSQHYIKRLCGMPGQTLQIDPPKLLINGIQPDLPAIRRVISMENGYKGYSNGGPGGGSSFRFLGSPEATYIVPPRSYFALGDNSYHSSDSRSWGSVPERNVAGRGFFVYWPFSERWGFIR
jgi:signal peptidase I